MARSTNRSEDVRRLYDRRYAGGQGEVVNQARVELLVRQVLRLAGTVMARPEHGTVLDVGCGLGDCTACFHRLGFSAQGVDLSGVAIEKARQRHPEVDFVVADAAEEFTGQEFDVVWAKGLSLFNTDDAAAFQGHFQRLLGLCRPGGLLVVLSSSDFSGSMPAEHWGSPRHEFFRRIVGECGRKAALVYALHAAGLLKVVGGSRWLIGAASLASRLVARCLHKPAVVILLATPPVPGRGGPGAVRR